MWNGRSSLICTTGSSKQFDWVYLPLPVSRLPSSPSFPPPTMIDWGSVFPITSQLLGPQKTTEPTLLFSREQPCQEGPTLLETQVCCRDFQPWLKYHHLMTAEKSYSTLQELDMIACWERLHSVNLKNFLNGKHVFLGSWVIEKQTKNSTILIRGRGEKTEWDKMAHSLCFCWGMLGLSYTPKTKSSFFTLAMGWMLCFATPALRKHAPLSPCRLPVHSRAY